ncbi:MAG: hypothetical protein SGARI_004230 [Bacillariaceae sp.]
MSRRRHYKTVLVCTTALRAGTVVGFTPRHTQKLYSTNNNNQQDFERLVQEATQPSQCEPPLGGDWAGLAATFNPGEGAFIPIPEYLVPDSLLEWGQAPKCLEVLVSEDIRTDSGEDATGEDDIGILQRVTTTVLPATGCGVDNLETLKAQDEVDLEARWVSGVDSFEDPSEDEGATKVVGLQYPIGNDNDNALRVETIFGFDYGGGQFRMRVAIDVVPSPPDTFGISSPMVLTLERRTNAISSGGTIANGGGLDGRTVMMLLGERLSGSKTFVDDPPMGGNFDRDSIKHVSFPGNVDIAYGWMTDNDWALQVGCVGPNGMRRVVSRQFTVAKSGELDFELRSWVEDPAETNV